MSYSNYQRWKDQRLGDFPELSIVIPAYNEAERIIPTIGAIASHVSDLGYEWELIVADDGSSDDTVELLEALSLSNLRILRTDANGGKGRAVQRGMLAAQGSYVLFTDADNSTPIENLDTLLSKLKDEGYDVAVGSRGASGASENNKSGLRKLMSWGLRTLAQIGLRLGIRDTQCGFKMYTRTAARRLHTAQTITGFSFDLEVLYLARKMGYRIAEVPVQWMDAPGSKVNAFKETRRFLRDILRIRLTDLRGIYDYHLRADAPVRPDITAGDALRIAVVTTFPPGKGSLNEYGYHFVEALRQKPEVQQVFILADELPRGQTYLPINKLGAPTTLVPSWRFNDPTNLLSIRRALQEIKPDVVLFNVQFASFGSRRVPAALGLLTPMFVRRTLNLPTVVLLHNIMETVDLKQAGFGGNPAMARLTRLFGTLVTRALLRADLVALTIPKYVDLVKQKYHVDNVFLAPHGSFQEAPLPDIVTDEDCLRIMTFGKFGTYKRVETLIEAYKKIKSKPGRRTELVIAGGNNPNAPGYLENIRDEYQHVPNIRFTGYVPEDDVDRIFQEATVVVFPYNSTTGSSGVLHQAGSYGRAVVLPDIGDFAELIRDEGYVGEFFEPSDAESLADAIERLLDDPEERREQGLQNYLAANGLPISDVVDWYLIHITTILNRYSTNVE